MWTQFMDMHSGGDIKEPPYNYIYIQASEEEAKVIFYNRFGHNPEDIACDCCGENYSISEGENIEQVTGYERGCEYVYISASGKEITTADWRKLNIEERIECKGKWIEKKRTKAQGPSSMSIIEYMKRKNVLCIA